MGAAGHRGIVHAALTHDPRERLADCATFAKLLEQAIPAAFRKEEPSVRPPTDDEVTVVAPLPKLDRRSARTLPPARTPMATTPLPEQFSVYSPPTAPTSHMRVVPPKPQGPGSSETPTVRTKPRSRGAMGIAVLMAAVCVAVVLGGRVEKIHRAPRTYSAAPATR